VKQLGGGSTYAYDALGRVTQLTHPDNTYFSIVYNERATEETDEGNGSGNVQHVYQIDGLGRLASVCEVTGNTSYTWLGITPTPQACSQDIAATGFLTSYTYDTLGNSLTVAQGGINGRSFTFDGLSRLATEGNPESGSVTYSYNSAGDLYQRIVPEPNQTGTAKETTTYTYDVLHRIASKTYSDGTPSVGYYYDQASPWGVTATNYRGRLTEAQTTSGSSVLTGAVFSYDQMGRVLNTWQCTPLDCGTTSTYFKYTYDYLGDLTSSYNNEDNITYTYQYNAADEMTSVQSNINTSPALVAFSSYYPIQKPQQVAFSNGITDCLSYGINLRLFAMNQTNTTCSSSGGIYDYAIWNYSSNTLGYAPDGNIIYASDSANGNWSYAYNSLNQLISGTCSANCPPTSGFTYTYDRFGNRPSETVTAGQGVQPQYEFNGQNQIDVSNVSYDAAGNVLTDGVGLGNTYTYDAENRIITAANGYSDSYVYDAFGHRVRATVNGQTHDFLYDLNGRTVDQLTSGTLARSEAYAGAMHVATYINGTPYFDNSDWESTFRVRGSTSATNLETCTSLPFGEDLTCTIPPASEVSPLHFTGQERDSESGDDHFPFRYYNEVMGRWLTPDPAGVAATDPTNPQSWNRYAYVMNNPLSNVDPMGLCGPGQNGGGYGVDCGPSWMGFSAEPGPGGAMGAEGCQIDGGGDAPCSLAFGSASATLSGSLGMSLCVGGCGVHNEWVNQPYWEVVGINSDYGAIQIGGCEGCETQEIQVNDWILVASDPFTTAGSAAANNGPTNPRVSCNSTTGICVPSSMVNGPSNWQRLKSGVKWYLCGNGSFDNIKNYTLEGLTKGVIVGGIAGWEGGPPGVALGALAGGVEGFFSGNAVGWVATAGCQAAGMYPPAS
jgi:RHS repeat-associated protein